MKLDKLEFRYVVNEREGVVVCILEGRERDALKLFIKYTNANDLSVDSDWAYPCWVYHRSKNW